MKVSKALNALADNLRVGASVRNVYGEPVSAGGRTVIPIARVGFGFGAGSRAGGDPETSADGAGSGGGAGMSARPVGALEITEAGTRFIPFIDPVRLGIALVLGIGIGFTVGRRLGQGRAVVDRIVK